MSRGKANANANPELGESVAAVVQELKKINDRIEGLQTQFSSKIDSLKDYLTNKVDECKWELKKDMEETAKVIQCNMDLEIGILRSKLEQLEEKITREKAMQPRYDPSVSVTVSGLAFLEGENVLDRVNCLLSEGLKCNPMPTVVAAERLTPRGRGPGLIKVELKSVSEKVELLRRKQVLRKDDRFGNVYIQSAKSHAERLVELNFRTLLRELPLGKDFFVSTNGRLIKRQHPDHSPGGRVEV